MTVQRTIYTSPIEALTALIRSLVAYEQRYQMSSAELRMPDISEVQWGIRLSTIEWAGDYQH